LGPLLKALGLTIWGLVALGLLAVFIFVGYQAALKFRSPDPMADTPDKNVQASGNPDLARVDGNAGALTIPGLKSSSSAPKPTVLDAVRKQFDEAAEQRRFGAVLDTGRHLYDAGLTTPDDLLIIAHAFSSIGDCDSARVWTERANDTLRTVGKEPSELAERTGMECTPGSPNKNPAINAYAANTTLADRFVKLGEAYYGFRDYQKAVTAIQRGLDMGGASHLDEAYIYLGQSELKLNNTEAACRSFQSLRGVPNISPRILKLWLLFADMHC
jgi:tetratricopeptide (TPR) repeat protein